MFSARDRHRVEGTLEWLKAHTASAGRGGPALQGTNYTRGGGSSGRAGTAGALLEQYRQPSREELSFHVEDQPPSRLCAAAVDVEIEWRCPAPERQQPVLPAPVW